MKKVLSILLCACFLVACGGSSSKEKTNTETNTKDTTVVSQDVKNKSFDELFKNIAATDIADNVFKLVGQDYTVITAGTDSLYNSMTASFGGWGQLFDKPTTWCILNGGRYTLEFIRKEQTYTMSYFADDYKEQVLAFGKKSGRNSEKMKETAFTSVKTPLGNISYKEARLIIECKLTGVTDTDPKNFYVEENRAFLEKGKKDGNGKDYHKLVFGEITNVWVRK